MFASNLPSWTASLRRAAALVKAFALLEDAPRGAVAQPRARRLADTPPLPLDHAIAAGGGHDGDLHAARVHPHRRALRATRERREGAVADRPAACTVPLKPRGTATRAVRVQNARWAAQRAAHR